MMGGVWCCNIIYVKALCCVAKDGCRPPQLAQVNAIKGGANKRIYSAARAAGMGWGPARKGLGCGLRCAACRLPFFRGFTYLGIVRTLEPGPMTLLLSFRRHVASNMNY